MPVPRQQKAQRQEMSVLCLPHFSEAWSLPGLLQLDTEREGTGLPESTLRLLSGKQDGPESQAGGMGRPACPLPSFFPEAPSLTHLMEKPLATVTELSGPLEQWFSTLLILQPFNMVPHVVGTPNHKIISSLLHNCGFAAVMNREANICVFRCSQVTAVKGSLDL